MYLFAGDRFGVNLTITKDEASGVTYQLKNKKADVEFTFTLAAILVWTAS